MARTLGVREYAKHREAQGLTGTTHAAVRKAIEKGRLSRSVTKDAKGWPRIDPVIADDEWEGSTDPAQQRPGPAQRELFADARKKDVRDSEEGITYTRARAVREGLNARIAELDLRERMGSLVDVAQVKAEAFDVGRKIREGLLGLPARLGPVVAGMNDPRACESLLQREIDEVLRELTDRARDG